MLAAVRTRLEAAGQMREFLHSMPFAEEDEKLLVTRFDELLARARSLALEEEVGRRDARVAFRTRSESRREGQFLLRMVTKAAELAARTSPELAGKFVPPGWHVSHTAFANRAATLVTLARQHLDVLAKNGLVASRVDRLAEILARFDAETERGGLHRRGHVGARAQLIKATEEMMQIAGLLDALNRARFETDPSSLAKWESARNVVTRKRSKPAIVSAPAAVTVKPEEKAA